MKIHPVKSDSLFQENDEIFFEYSDLIQEVKTNPFLIKNVRNATWRHHVHNTFTYTLNMTDKLGAIDFDKSILEGYKPRTIEFDIEEGKLIFSKETRFKNLLSHHLYYEDIKTKSYSQREKINCIAAMYRFEQCLKHLEPGGNLITTIIDACYSNTIEILYLGLLLFKRMAIYDMIYDFFFVAFEDFDPMIEKIPSSLNFEITNKPNEHELMNFLKEAFTRKYKNLLLIKHKKYDEFQAIIDGYIIKLYQNSDYKVRAEIYKMVLPFTKMMLTNENKLEKINSNIRYEEGLFLQKIIKKFRVKKALEVGMAFGMSALFITGALPEDGTLTSIDPYQKKQWKNRGIELLKNVGLDHKHKLIEDKSYNALPKLLSEINETRESDKYDLIFIDGWHTFDYTLIDFFYSDLLIKKNGIIVVDDVLHKGVSKVIRYIMSNYKHYKPYKHGSLLEKESMMAFIKMDDDKRDWNFHADF